MGFRSAYAAYIAGILINVVGFAGASKSFASVLLDMSSSAHYSARAAGRTVPIAATHIYQMSFFTGFGVSAIVYCTLNYAFPAAGAHHAFEEIDVMAHAFNEHSSDDAETSSIVKGKQNFSTDIHSV